MDHECWVRTPRGVDAILFSNNEKVLLRAPNGVAYAVRTNFPSLGVSDIGTWIPFGG